MIERDDGRGFREPVALNHHEAHPPPELLEIGRERRGADDERPELEAERGMHPAVPPPAAGNGHAGWRRLVRFGEGARDVLAQDVENLGHAHQHRHTPRLNQVEQVVRVEAAREDHRSAHHRRNGGGHRLAEHVAQRQEIEEAHAGETAGRTGGISGSSRSTGTTLASTFRCRMTTPLGSAVAPDVKMICDDVVARHLDAGIGPSALPVEVGKAPLRGAPEVGDLGEWLARRRR